MLDIMNAAHPSTDYSLIVAICTMLVALCALLLSMYLGFLDRQYKRLSVKPLITSRMKIFGNGFTFTLKNSGLGVAIITDFKIFYDGSEISHEKYVRVVQKYFPASPNYRDVDCDFWNNNYKVTPNQTIDMIKLEYITPITVNGTRTNILAGLDSKEFAKMFKFSLAFKSLYGKKFNQEINVT